MAIDIEGNSSIIAVGRCWPEVGRAYVTTPVATFFVAVCITGYEEARIEVGIADQQLVFITCVCYSSALPQSWQSCLVISRGCKGGTELVREESFLSCVLVHKKNLPKLQENNKYTRRNSVLSRTILSCDKEGILKREVGDGRRRGKDSRT